MNNKGQSILTEYSMIFFVVIAALTGMSVFVQRALQARVHDARNYMINAVATSGACDANCLQATGGSINYEYEPYYQQVLSGSSKSEQDNMGITNGTKAAIGAIYLKSMNEVTNSTAVSDELPPECADGANPKPTYCNNIQLPLGN